MPRSKGFDVNAFNWFPYGEGHDVPAEVPGGWHGLYTAEALSVKQAVGILEALTDGCCEQPNQYVVLNGHGQKLFTAEEESSACWRCCCAPNHEFTINIRDHNNAPVLGIYHPCKCGGCCACCDFCRDEVHLYEGEAQRDEPWRQSNNDKLRGVIKMPTCGGGLTPTFEVFNVVNGVVDTQPEAEITGPTCCIGACCDAEFTMQAPGAKDSDPGQYGKVMKEGFKDMESAAIQLFTDAQVFQLQFEQNSPYFGDQSDWSRRMWTKAKLLGGLFALEYLFFEDDGIFQCCPEPDVLCSLKCCDLYCCGCIWPCKCECRKGDDN